MHCDFCRREFNKLKRLKIYGKEKDYAFNLCNNCYNILYSINSIKNIDDIAYDMNKQNNEV